jgi:uncharacterized membrane protein YebE (DUF533 family)
MFDAKSILENMMRGATPSGPASSSPSPNGSLSDILNQIGKSLSDGQQQAQAPISTQSNSGPSTGTITELGDILAQIKGKLGQAGGAVTDGNSIADILGKVLSQASQGVEQGSTRIGEATGASDALGRLESDPHAAEIISKLKDFVAKNPYAAGAAAGGLGGLVLGTHAGRSLAASAARVGALAMIGGLAYKAVQNYQAGKPLITGAASTEPPPPGSGFEPSAVSNDAAIHYIQAMIAAAHADGRIDPSEHDKIVASLKQAGLGGEAEAFFAKELNSPATVQELAQAVDNPQEAAQLYTAARIAVADKSPAEKAFLSSLAAALKLDPALAAHIDATTAAAA